MKKGTCRRFLLSSLMLLCPLAAPANPWSEMREPYPLNDLKAASIGTYAAGCLAGAARLNLDGPGYQVMRPSRRRHFGHPTLVTFLTSMGQQVERKNLGALLVGDLSQPRGGPMRSGHRSHQTGLDVDLWYWLDSPAARHTLSVEERENLSAPSMLAADGLNLDPSAWRPGHTQLLRLAAKHPGVERIFVNPAIKRHLCQTLPAEDRDWLHKVRPWWGHDDHFHVRLRCPETERACIAQEPVNPGNGCDASLDWWFSAEAQRPTTKRPPEEEPRLPQACVALLYEPAEQPPAVAGRIGRPEGIDPSVDNKGIP